MNKHEFLVALRDRLSGLPEEDIERSVEYYGEIIEDRMEDGLSEEEAVKAVGSIEEIVSQILSETSLPKLVKAKVKPNRALKSWEIVLIILGFPLWLPLLAAALIIVLAIYIVIWSVIITLYAVAISFAACAIAGVFGSLIFVRSGNIPEGTLFFGAGLACVGIAILLFFGFHQISKSILHLSKKLLLGIKARFIRKEDA